jgi:hypothetical protein
MYGWGWQNNTESHNLIIFFVIVIGNGIKRRVIKNAAGGNRKNTKILK